MAESYGSNLAIIRYHAWWAGYDPYYQFNTPENRARIYYYGADYAPHFWIDGVVNGGSNRFSWDGLIAAELRVESPLEIDIDANYNPSDRSGELEITVTATARIVESNLKLRIAITESNIYWHAPNNTDWHHQTFRDMIPHTSGIAFSISEGQTLTFNESFSLDAQLVDDNCEIVVFVQSDNGRRILQGAKTNVPSGDCVYTPGDSDGNDAARELTDLVAMIAFYRGISNPEYICQCPDHPDYRPHADADGNCTPFELTDVVKSIAAYRGPDPLSGCVDCPGSR